MIENRNFYINGQWVAPAKANDLQVINPSDESVCGVISIGDETDTNAAVAAAKAAFKSWSATSVAQRLELLEKLLSIYKCGMEDMGKTISMEMGAPIDMALASQAGAGYGHLIATIEALKNFEFDRPLGDHAPGTLITHEPIGVCALITPWNWPMNQVVLKVAPALAAGCTMVLKPSEISPLSSMLFAQMVHEAGFPAGVFNLVNGDGTGVGTQLSSHADIDMVSFTGSSRAGTAISQNAAANIKRVSLELGGKGANIIFADADEKAVARGVRHCFNNSGQSCNAPTRMIVERSIYDQTVAAAKAVAESTGVDEASVAGRHIGPVVSKLQFDKIQTLIQKGIDEGARLVAGGTGLPESKQRGYYVKPTIFADVNNDMHIAREEIFGPVLSIIPFDSEEEAVEIANDTPYGLGNYLQTTDSERAKRVARQLRSGMVQINGESLSSDAPFGGYKQSGNGREGGPWGFEDFLEVKAISGWSS